MVRYDIAKLATGRRKGTAQLLPPIHGSVGAEAAYLKALRSVLRELAAYVRQNTLPVAERDLATKRATARLTADMGEHDLEALESFAARLAAVASNVVRRILALEARRHTSTFLAAAKRVLGVDLSAVVRQEDLEDYLNNAAIKNAGLIKGLASDVVKRISQTVMNAVVNGSPVKALRKKLTEDFGLADRRAKLIARNEIASLNADLNRERQVQAGVTTYTWRTAHDERVRALHRDLDGKVYEYGKPTGAEQGLPPGKPINCRCIAVGIVQF